MSGLSEREAAQAAQHGAAARRGGKRVGDCPYRGKTPRVRAQAELWLRGWQDEDAAIRARAARAGAP